MTLCLYPSRADYTVLPDGWDEWRTTPECAHEWCLEVEGWHRQWKAERAHRESMALARADLDMPHATDDELSAEILWSLK